MKSWHVHAASIARAARDRGATEALGVAAEALPTDNEALALSEQRVDAPKTPYRTRKRKTRR